MASINTYDAGQQSYTGTHAGAPTLFTPQQSLVRDAINVWPPHPLKYLICSLEAWSVNAPFVCVDANNGDYSGNYDLANHYYNTCRSYRSHHYYGPVTMYNNAGHTGTPNWHIERGTVDDTSSATDFYPSQSVSSQWSDPLNYYGTYAWYWDDPNAWPLGIWNTLDLDLTTASNGITGDYAVSHWVSDEWDMSGVWGYMKSYLLGVDMTSCWTPLPAPTNANRGWWVNNYPTTGYGLETTLPPVASTLPGSLGIYDGFIYQTSSSGTMTGSADATGALYPGNLAPWGDHLSTIDTLTGMLHPGGEGSSPSNLTGGIYISRVQVKFNLPITYVFAEIVQGYGRVNQNFYMMRNVGRLNAETVIELPQPVMFPGHPFIFQGATCPLAAKESVVIMLVNQTMESWMATNDATGQVITPSYTGSPPLQVAPTMDSSVVTVDSSSYTMDAT